MRRLILASSILSLALLGYAGAATLLPRGPQPPTAPFPDGFASKDALIDAWLDALANGDEQALHRLRVNRREYLEVLMPWNVKPGDPPRQYSAEPSEYFWQLLDTRSRDWGHAMIARYGGTRFRPVELTFSGPVREYAGYRAHGLVRLRAENEDGEPVTVDGPFIAEVAGTYKFIGLDWTD